jgi:hypothetical protein
LAEQVMKEVALVHTIERYEELAEKKPIFRKIINTIHQTEYSLSSN